MCVNEWNVAITSNNAQYNYWNEWPRFFAVVFACSFFYLFFHHAHESIGSQCKRMLMDLFVFQTMNFQRQCVSFFFSLYTSVSVCFCIWVCLFKQLSHWWHFCSSCPWWCCRLIRMIYENHASDIELYIVSLCCFKDNKNKLM